MGKKRHHGEGSLVKSGAGYRLVKMVAGKKLSGPVVKSDRPTLEVRKQAEKAWRDRFEDNPHTPFVPTLRELFCASLERKFDERKSYFYDKYILTSRLGSLPVTHIKPSDIESFISELISRGHKPSGINRYLDYISSPLSACVRDGVIPRNPVSGLKRRVPPNQFKRVLTPGELEAFLALPWPEWYRVGLLLMLHGLRGQEARRLRHEDWDGTGFMVKETKTGVDRWVPAMPDLAATLSSKTSGRVWTKDGRDIDVTLFRSGWDTVIKGSKIGKSAKRVPPGHGFEDVTPHDLRSTTAMRLLEKGVDMRTAAEILGHSPSMLAGVYARSRKDLKQDAIMKILG